MNKIKKAVALGLWLIIVLSMMVMFGCSKQEEAFVTYIVDGEQYKKVQYLDAESAAYPADPIRKDYTFSGWYRDAGLEARFELAVYVALENTKSISVYGKFTKNDIVLSFNTQGGSDIADVVVTESILEPASVPSLEGHNFCGWYLEDRYINRVTFPLTLTENKTIYAKWALSEGDFGFSYKNGAYAITSYLSKSDSSVPVDVTVPKKYDEIAVTEIGRSVFYKNKKIATVSLPDSLISIGASAFESSSITSINIPSSVTTIDGHIFSECTSLVNVTFDEGSKLEVISESMFKGSNIASLVLPQGIKEIKGFSFSGCASLTSIIITAKVEKIESRAFNNCSALNSVTFATATGWSISGKPPIYNIDLTDAAKNATYLIETHVSKEWTKK